MNWWNLSVRHFRLITGKASRSFAGLKNFSLAENFLAPWKFNVSTLTQFPTRIVPILSSHHRFSPEHEIVRLIMNRQSCTEWFGERQARELSNLSIGSMTAGIETKELSVSLEAFRCGTVNNEKKEVFPRGKVRARSFISLVNSAWVHKADWHRQNIAISSFPSAEKRRSQSAHPKSKQNQCENVI